VTRHESTHAQLVLAAEPLLFDGQDVDELARTAARRWHNSAQRAESDDARIDDLEAALGGHDFRELAARFGAVLAVAEHADRRG
jgi:hypothetical protein